MLLTRLAGNLEESPEDKPDQWLQAILQESPAVKIAQGSTQSQGIAWLVPSVSLYPLQLRGGL